MTRNFPGAGQEHQMLCARVLDADGRGQMVLWRAGDPAGALLEAAWPGEALELVLAGPELLAARRVEPEPRPLVSGLVRTGPGRPRAPGRPWAGAGRGPSSPSCRRPFTAGACGPASARSAGKGRGRRPLPALRMLPARCRGSRTGIRHVIEAVIDGVTDVDGKE